MLLTHPIMTLSNENFFPRYWPFVRGIHRSPVNSPYKGQWRGSLMFSLICARINGWVNSREAGDVRQHRAHYDVILMPPCLLEGTWDAVKSWPPEGAQPEVTDCATVLVCACSAIVYRLDRQILLFCSTCDYICIYVWVDCVENKST